MTPAHREWAGVSRYMASDASNNTTASTISETMINVSWPCSFSGLRRAQAVSEKKQPCSLSYILPFLFAQCEKHKADYQTSAQMKSGPPSGLSYSSLHPISLLQQH